MHLFLVEKDRICCLHLGFGRWTDFVVMRMREYQARE